MRNFSPAHPIGKDAVAANGARERHRRQTDARIRAAAMELVRQYGIHNVTVAMISEAAGISVRTFFNYMPNKQAALVDALPLLEGYAGGSLSAAPGTEALLPDIEQLLVAYAENITTALRSAAMTALNRTNPGLPSAYFATLELFENQLQTVLVERLGGNKAHAEVLAATVAAMVRLAFQRWTGNTHATTFEAELHECLTTVATLLAPDITGSALLAEPDMADALEFDLDADMALYNAKDAGREEFPLLSPSRRAQARADLNLRTERKLRTARRLEHALRGALERDELAVHYQPIVNLQTDQLIGFESLMRWRHPEFGAPSPAEFIPIAEATGLIDASGAWLLQQAAGQLVEWRANRAVDLPALHMSVNVAVRQLQDPGLVDVVRTVLDHSGLPPAGLWLELTESAAMQDLDASLDVLHRLYALGVTLCIDDFGTGYSSLSYLSQIPARIVKIDRSFVSRIGRSAEDAAIIRSVLAMATALDREVVAEGVETPEQRDWLRALGCQMAQGYFYGRPQSASAYSAWLGPSRGADVAPLVPGTGGSGGPLLLHLDEYTAV